jgi:hypothetical protein
MGIGLLATSCLAQSDDVGEIDDVGLETQDLNDPTGGTGQNGLYSEDYAGTDGVLWSATTKGVYDPTNTFLAQLHDAELNQGSETLKYAVRCAMESSTTLFGTTYPGGNLLSTTSGWLTGGLSTAAREDLMTCMIIHVNPSNIEVPIQLMGDAVPNSLAIGQAAAFGVDEALWVARETAGGDVEYLVWPLEGVSLNCANPSQSILSRVCGTAEGEQIPSCQVDVRSDVAGECSQDVDTGNWTCLRHRAIKTKLKAIDFLTLYPGCDPIPQ